MDAWLLLLNLIRFVDKPPLINVWFELKRLLLVEQKTIGIWLERDVKPK